MQTTVNKKPVQRAAVLHDLCTVGKAAMTNILPVLSILGIEACPVPTMALSTHTGGFGQPFIRALGDFPTGCAEHLKSQGISFQGVLVGYLGKKETVREAENFLRAIPSKMVLLDPVMGDHGTYYSNFDEMYQQELKRLIPFSTLVTPNYTEACFLAGETYEPVFGTEKWLRIVEKLKDLGVKQAVVTSVPMGGELYALGILDGEFQGLVPYQSAGRAYPGTGDLFAAVLLGGLLKGKSLKDAAKGAHKFVGICIRKSDEAGYDTREGVLLEPSLPELFTLFR